MTRLNEDSAITLVQRVTGDCVNHILDMRDMGASPGDMMTALTLINTSIIAYVHAASGTEKTLGSTLRLLSTTLKERVPPLLEAYKGALKEGKEL